MGIGQRGGGSGSDLAQLFWNTFKELYNQAKRQKKIAKRVVSGFGKIVLCALFKVLSCCVCVFIPSPVREGSTLFWDHRGSILSNRAETSQEGQCVCQPEEISAQSNLGQEKTYSINGILYLGQHFCSMSMGMRPDKYPHQSYSHSVELIFYKLFETNLALSLVGRKNKKQSFQDL